MMTIFRQQLHTLQLTNQQTTIRQLRRLHQHSKVVAVETLVAAGLAAHGVAQTAAAVIRTAHRAATTVGLRRPIVAHLPAVAATEVLKGS